MVFLCFHATSNVVAELKDALLRISDVVAAKSEMQARVSELESAQGSAEVWHLL